MNGIKKALSLVLALVMVLGLGVCAVAAEGDEGKIVILHTNDVHCGIDRAEKASLIGYSRLIRKLRKQRELAESDRLLIRRCVERIAALTKKLDTLTF